jgi:hypothetical protein
VLGCCGCALGLLQLLRLRVHLTLRVADLLLKVVHDHLFACKGCLRSCRRSCCVLGQTVLRLESSLSTGFVLVLDGCVSLVSCPLGDRHQAAPDTVSYAVVMSVASVATPIAEILGGRTQVAEVVVILVV